MISRRALVGSSISLGGTVLASSLLLASNPPTTPTSSQDPAPPPGPVDAMAPKIQAISNVGYMLVALGGMIARKSFPVVLEGLEAIERGAQGVGGLFGKDAPPATAAGEKAIKTDPQTGDLLMRLGRLEADLHSLMSFREPPILPQRQEPERIYVFQPLIWSPQGVIYGQRYNMPADNIVGDHTLYAPGYAATGIEQPGVYRAGYMISSLDEQTMLYGGGPFMHVFADQVWDYERILADHGQAATPEIDAPLYQVNPFDDPDLQMRLSVAE